MKTRRLLAVLTAAAMSATLLTGCGGDKPAANGSGSGSGSGAKSGDGYNITMICGNRDEFGSALEQGSLAVAKEMNVKLTTQDAQNDMSAVRFSLLSLHITRARTPFWFRLLTRALRSSASRRQTAPRWYSTTAH